jgi:hypothetical protein
VYLRQTCAVVALRPCADAIFLMVVSPRSAACSSPPRGEYLLQECMKPRGKKQSVQKKMKSQH